MSTARFLSASLLVVGLPLVAAGQTVGGSPTAPAPSGTLGVPPPASSRAGSRPAATLPAAKMQPMPKPTAAERAEKRQIDHDLHICVGC